MVPIIIGIAGGSASGKTSIAKILKQRFEESQSVYIITMDDYYKDQSDIDFSERLKTNYDHPFAFDMDLLIDDLKTLKSKNPINKPIYDFINHTRSQKSEVVYPANVLVVEGLMALENKELRSLLDIKVFVDTDVDIRFIRRLIRDVKKRGRTMDNVIEQYLTTVRLMHEQFVEPSKRYADIIIPEGAHNVVAIDLLTTKISSIINKDQE